MQDQIIMYSTEYCTVYVLYACTTTTQHSNIISIAAYVLNSAQTHMHHLCSSTTNTSHPSINNQTASPPCHPPPRPGLHLCLLHRLQNCSLPMTPAPSACTGIDRTTIRSRRRKKHWPRARLSMLVTWPFLHARHTSDRIFRWWDRSNRFIWVSTGTRKRPVDFVSSNIGIDGRHSRLWRI